jgi:hypothetical protein
MHDLAILQYVLRGEPIAVSATGMSHVPGEIENIAYLTLFYPDNFIAHIHVNWLAPVKIRRTLLGGSRRMLIYDDVEGSEKIKVYDKGVHLAESSEGLHQLRINYRAGDMWAPHRIVQGAETGGAENLSVICGHQPLTDGQAGLKVVRVLETATASMALRGQVLEIHRAGVSRSLIWGLNITALKKKSIGLLPEFSKAVSSSWARKWRASKKSSPPTAAAGKPSESIPEPVRCTWPCWPPGSARVMRS